MRVPSACISSTIWFTAATRLAPSSSRALVEGDRQRLEEHRIADDLHRVLGGVSLCHGQGRDRRIESGPVAKGQVLEGGGVGVVAGDLGIVDEEVELEPFDLQCLLEEEVIGAGAADADGGAVEVGAQIGDGCVVLVHHHHRRGEVVRRGEVEHRLPLVGGGHRAHAHVPPPVPGARRDDVPRRCLPGHLDPEPVGDLGGDVDVEALVLLGLLVERRLWRIGRVGGDPDRPRLADLRKQVTGGVRLGTHPGTGGVPRGVATRTFAIGVVVVSTTRRRQQRHHHQQPDNHRLVIAPPFRFGFQSDGTPCGPRWIVTPVSIDGPVDGQRTRSDLDVPGRTIGPRSPRPGSRRRSMAMPPPADLSPSPAHPGRTRRIVVDGNEADAAHRLRPERGNGDLSDHPCLADG